MRTASLTVHRYCLPHSNIGTSLPLSYSEGVEVFAAFVWLFSLYEKKKAAIHQYQHGNDEDDDDAVVLWLFQYKKKCDNLSLKKCVEKVI